MFPTTWMTPTIKENSTLENIADTMAWLFSFRLVPFQTFSDYMDEILLPGDRCTCVKEELYQKYLDKISATGRKLANKMRDEKVIFF